MTIQLEERGIWRDFDSLLPDDAHLAPRVIENAVVLSKMDRIRLSRGVMILGQRYFPPDQMSLFGERNTLLFLKQSLEIDSFVMTFEMSCLKQRRQVKN